MASVTLKHYNYYDNNGSIKLTFSHWTGNHEKTLSNSDAKKLLLNLENKILSTSSKSIKFSAEGHDITADVEYCKKCINHFKLKNNL